MYMSNKTPQEIVEIIRSLASESKENGEYDRALVEVGAALLGMSETYADFPEVVTDLILGES